MTKKSIRIIAFIAIICLTISLGTRFLFSGNILPDKLARRISLNLQKELQIVEEEERAILQDSSMWNSVTHSFFLVDSLKVLNWKDNDFLPDLRVLQDSFDVRFAHTSRGDFVIKKKYLSNGRSLLAVIPLIEQYKISNSFLKPKWNLSIFPFSDISVMDISSPDGYPVTLSDRSIFFKISITPTSITSSGNFTVVVLWWIGIISLLIFVFAYVHSFYRQGKPEQGFLILLLSLILVRLTCVYFNIPNLYFTQPVFDPRVFASSSVNPSIGDLFLNTVAIFILCIYIFFTYSEWKSLKRLSRLVGVKKYLASTLLIVISFFAILFPFLYFETISHNSSISLDITQSLQFELVRVTAFLCVGLSSLAAFCIAHVCLRMSISVMRYRSATILLFLLIGVLCFILYSIALERDYWITIFCAFSYFFLVCVFKLYHTLRTISYPTFLYFFLAIFLFAVQGALSVRRFTEEERISSQFRFANEFFLVGRDFLGEFLLNESISKIREDPFIQSRLANPFLNKASIRQKIRQIYLNNYFDRYDTRIYLYNSVGAPVDSEPFLDFASQVQAYENRASTTGYKGIYFTSDSLNQNDRKYLLIAPIHQSGIPVGFVVLELSLKKLVPRNVYPELLVDNRFAVYLRSKDFSYAVYSRGKLMSSFGDFNYDRDFKNEFLNQKDIYARSLLSGDFVHVGIEDEDGRVAIVSSHAYPLFYVLSNFSFWIVTGLLFVLLSLIIQGLYFLLNGQQINYSSRVQLYFYSALLLPLLAVSITTLSITTRSAGNQLNAEFINKSKLLGESLAPDLVSFVEDQEIGTGELERRIRNLARVSDVDASVYDSTGLLIGSSQPLIFDYQFKSELIDRDALNRIKDKEITFVKQDRIGSLNYHSAFCAIRSPETGHLIGIVSLPFFSAVSSLEKNQINILTIILSIFTIVLILFSILSLIAADQLTYPLRIIARSLGRTTLTGHNEPLAWNSSDEIGVMVKEYNRMVRNLEQSKIELARSQKESAWREMAKQVAHEIKNPLTPMKLTLQQMEQMLKREEGLSKEKAERSIKTMLSQVEILNEIASSFSTFARMPAPNMVRLEMNSLLKKAVDLYSDNSNGKVVLIAQSALVYVMGDEQLMTRIFSNIILNALQAGDGTQQVDVSVSLKSENHDCLVSVEDNGIGISSELKEKIFLPYFTTKKSGSGLGLAIVKQGVEQSGGSISIESKEGKGTIFYIRFLLVS